MSDLSHTNPAHTAATVDLLQQMIRNACVNDGTPESGEEVRNSDMLENYLEHPGVDIEHFDSLPGRRSLVARIEGSDPQAPKLCLMGHTDVVPVNPEGWSRDPFGGELVGGDDDGVVWGRGAIDMLNLTSSMAVAFRHLAIQAKQTGKRPLGDLIYFGVADEEAGGTYGAKWMVDNNWDPIACDYVLTEFGGLPTKTSSGMKLTLAAGEKGVAWRKLKVRGTPSHGSMPFGTDNALIKAAEVVRRIADYRPQSSMTEMWQHQVDSLTVDDDIKAALLDPETVWDEIESVSDKVSPGLARHLHACSHTTFSPNVIEGGTKTNVVADKVEIEVDIRRAAGDAREIDEHLKEAIGDLYSEVEVEHIFDEQATFSSTDTPLWRLLGDLMAKAHPDTPLMPSLILGATDARFFRSKGVVAYGAGLFSDRGNSEDFMSRFHGNDERVDVESLALTTQLWIDVVNNWDQIGHP